MRIKDGFERLNFVAIRQHMRQQLSGFRKRGRSVVKSEEERGGSMVRTEKHKGFVFNVWRCRVMRQKTNI